MVPSGPVPGFSVPGFSARVLGTLVHCGAMPELISVFTIAAGELGGRSKGRLHTCGPPPDAGFPDRLVQHKNYRGFSYEENHLEEWIARQPSSLFGGTPVLLLASQNYVHLRAKIDLLFVDMGCRLFPTELKVVRVAKNGGIVPYDPYERQMKPYAEYLKDIPDLNAFNSQCVRFTTAFNGAPSTVAEAFTATFGGPPSDTLAFPVCEIYVAEEFDAYALDYFASHSTEQKRVVRLISYKFFPTQNYIEFWKVYETPQEEWK